MFRSILAATDFSVGSDRALEVAATWAEQQHASLELLHVLEASPPLPGDVSGITGDLDAWLVRDVEHRMAERVARVRERVPTARGTVVRGVPDRELLRRSETIDRCLVVMGTDGRGAIARAILGSVADRMLRSSPSPLLFVPSDARIGGGIARAIVTLTDGSAATVSAVAHTLELARELKATVELVQSFEAPAFAGWGPDQSREVAKAITGQLEEKHRARARELSVDLRIHVREGTPARLVIAVAEETKADLIMVTSTTRSILASFLLEGTIDRVVRTSHVPVLVVRPAETV